jgi:hypothetical protein
MKRKVLITIVAAVIMLVSGMPAFAQGSYPPGTTWNSPFVVQNIGTVTSMVYVEYYRISDGAFISTATESFSVQPGRGRLVDPKLNPDPNLTAGLYSVVISSDEPVAAVVSEEATNRQMGYTGLEAGGEKVYLPNITKGYYTFNTPFYIQNSGTSTTAVTIEFFYFNTGQKVTSATKLISLAPNVSYEYDVALIPNAELPTNMQYSVVATAAAGGSIVGAVNQISSNTYLSYSGFAGGADTVYAPNIVKGYSGYITPAVIQNVGTAEAWVTVEYWGMTDGVFYAAAGAKNVPLGPGLSLPERPWTWADGVLPNNKQYSMIIKGRPGDKLVAIVNQNGVKDGTAYNAFIAGYRYVYIPWAMKQPSGGYLSPMVIQNVGATSATFSVRYYDLDTGVEYPNAGAKNQVLAAGQSIPERPWTYSDANLPTNKRFSIVIEGQAGNKLAAICTHVKLGTADLSFAYEGVGHD